MVINDFLYLRYKFLLKIKLFSKNYKLLILCLNLSKTLLILDFPKRTFHFFFLIDCIKYF